MLVCPRRKIIKSTLFKINLKGEARNVVDCFINKEYPESFSKEDIVKYNLLYDLYSFEEKKFVLQEVNFSDIVNYIGSLKDERHFKLNTKVDSFDGVLYSNAKYYIFNEIWSKL